ncbi:MAG: amidohydrolase [Verrucomicrobia bacterium]|nr:amidohydrolase [Verrucomicrobiota bacterium]
MRLSDGAPAHSARGLSRREFLSAAATSATVLSIGCRSAAVPGVPRHIDAHVHLWTSDLSRYPIDAGFKESEMQPPLFTPEQLFAHTRPNGVERVVLIQMSYYRFNNQYMLDCMRRFPGVFSGVAIVDETAPRLSERMRALANQGVRGFRVHPGAQPLASWIGSAGMADLWEAAADQGLAVCPLINPEALPAIAMMCRRYPRTLVVIDHFARIGIDGWVRDEQIDALCVLARFPNTFVKTSAFYALGLKQSPYIDLGPMVQRLRDAFGAQRLMWASDCPFQVDPGHNYADSISLIRDRLGFLSASDREWMLRRTAETVFFRS